MKFNFYNIQWTKTQTFKKTLMDDIVIEEKYKMLLRKKRGTDSLLLKKIVISRWSDQIRSKHNCKLQAWPAAPWTGYDDVSLLTYSSAVHRKH